MLLADPSTAARSPRQRREIERVRHAAVAARVGPTPAMTAALAQIGAAFDEAAMINAFKIRVERLIRLGPRHPAVRARFGARAAILVGRDLDTAIALAERWWRDERQAFQIASALGCATRLSLEILSELRLILRLMRWKKMHGAFSEGWAAPSAAIDAAAE
jgi:ATP phosphoribosyltransferase regulatory subunit HisZ